MTTVGFHVKAGIKTGHGHIIRCLALADELERRGTECYFNTNAAGTEEVKKSEHFLIDKVSRLSGVGTDFDVWVLDLEGGVPPGIAEWFRPFCKTLVILNGVGYPDGDPGRLLADLVFYQGVTDRPATLDWTGFDGRWFVGPEYLILRDEFRRVRRTRTNSPEPSRIVIAGGGSDPKNITRFALSALADFKGEIKAIIGPSNHNRIEVFNGTPVEFVTDPIDMAKGLDFADLAIVSYGMTAFECLCMGLPTLALSISPDHAASAELVEQESQGALFNFGKMERVDVFEMREVIDAAFAHLELFSKRASDFVDGRGAERVASLILESLT